MDKRHADCEPFPVQGGLGHKGPSTIPRWLAEIVYEGYSNRYGTSQSLDRMGERGGFGREEVVKYIRYPEGIR